MVGIKSDYKRMDSGNRTCNKINCTKRFILPAGLQSVF